jgi:hypothetical protein
MYAFAAIPFVLLTARPQDPPEVLATFKLEGKSATVTRNDVAIEMAFHLRRQQRGQQACEVMVDTTLARTAAKKQNLMPTEAEVRAFWNELQKQLRAAGQKPEDFAAVRNTSMAQWFEDLAVQIAQERLVRPSSACVPTRRSAATCRSSGCRKSARSTRSSRTPTSCRPGTAARDRRRRSVDRRPRQPVAAHERGPRSATEFVRKIVYLQSLETLARKEGVQLTDADLDEP